MKPLVFALTSIVVLGSSVAARAQDAGAGPAPDAGQDIEVAAPALATPSASPSPAPPPPPSTPEPPKEGQWDEGVPPEATKPPAERPDSLVDPTMSRSWWEGPNRWFFAGTVDAGYLYLRPRASVGFGLPFTRWVGIDANPLASGAGVAAYGGIRVALERVDLRLGSRYFHAFNHAYLSPQESYGRLDIENVERNRTRVLTHEIELNASLPAGPGDILTLLSGSYIANVKEGTYLFEETLKVVVNPPLVWRVRGGYAFRLGKFGQHSVGLVGDFLNVPKREGDTTVRAGPVMRIVLSRHFEVRGSFVVTVVSPDRLGLIGGDFTELGVRYRFATEPKQSEPISRPD